jgi:subtilase family serine protease
MRSCLVLIFTAGVLLDAQAPRRQIRENIDERKLVTLAGNTRPEVSADRDLGPVPDDFPMPHLLMQLRRSPEQETALEAFIDDLHHPGSPNFHRWLTAQQFGEKYGLAPQDLNAIGAWLRAHGFIVNVVYPSGTLIDFGGTAGQARAAFHTEIHWLNSGDIRHFANMRDPQIPAALAPAVTGILALHDFSPHPMHKPRVAKARPNYTFDNGNIDAVAPQDLATIYNFNPLFSGGISGQGQTIAVIEDTDLYSTADWTTYRSTFGLSAYAGTLKTVNPAPPSGTNNCDTTHYITGDQSEAILDAELAAAAAPSATIEVAACGTASGLFVALQNLVNGTAPPAVMSISYGECEITFGAANNAALSAIYQQAVAEGVSIFVSAGDEGAAGCDPGETAATHGIGVSALASTAYNVAVGATDFGDSYLGNYNSYWNASNTSVYGSAFSYIPEIPWNDSCAGILLASFFDFQTSYGPDGFCASTTAVNSGYQTVVAGSGGPSGCASGTPSLTGVVSGTCAGRPKPSWQTGVLGIPNDGVRDLPDVSLFGANGVWGHYYVFCWSDVANGGAACTGAPSTWSGAGGTSFSSPIMAGIQALINQKNGGRQGNPNYVYYPLAAQEYGLSGSSACNSTNGNATSASCIFYDVTLGDIDVNCTGSNNCYGDAPTGAPGVLSTSNSSLAPAFGTAIGWDFATGIGSVNAFNLVNNWGNTQATGMVTIQTNPTGLQFSVDGGALQTAPQTLNLSLGSHTISAATQAGATGVRYVFFDWSDNGSTFHSITVTATPATYTATFQTQYQLTVAASPSAGGAVIPSSPSYYSAGATAAVSATANTGYSFVNWSGPVTNTNSPSTTITMSAPESVTANFTLPGAHRFNAGIFRSGFFWLLDVDGNMQFDSPPDLAFPFGGIAGDIPITGDWNGNGHTKVGIYRPGNGLFILDTNGDGVFDAGDAVFNFGAGIDPTDIPVVGDWNGSGTSKVGLFRQGFFWILDYNGDHVFEQGTDKTYAFGGVAGDLPVVGDWTGSGTSKIGIFRLGFYWLLDANGNGTFDAGDYAFPFGGISKDVPVVGDWTGSGVSKVGVFREGFFWVLDGNNPGDATHSVGSAFAFGGITNDKPVTGKW